jgi:phosphatidylglycerol:prolipoprotein diacylglycerol transferase
MTIFELNILWFTIAPSYYGLMYALSFLFWYYILIYRSVIKKEDIDDLFFYIFLWVVLWGRLWYVLFYNISSYISEPLSILKFWEWWMSFHWWVIWVIFAMVLFSKKYNFSFLKLSDQITLIIPIWLFLWRIWNYINWELLWYSWYNWILAIYVNWIWYFPSPLIEALLEWVVLFIILNYLYKHKKMQVWQLASLFLILYSIFRILIEIFIREPDSNIWYILWYLTMWEILSVPMLLIWSYLFFKFREIKK